MNNLFFDKDYQEKIESGYAGIRIDTADKIITFSTSEDVSFISLPAFISPSLDSVEMLEIEEEPEPGIRWALFILILFFLVIVGFVIYIILQHWYKTKYETYLFKNRNYLFNLVNYIHAQKEKGVKESEMIKKLKKQGWNSEQITYVMRKYLGKRTGMWEIPVEKLLNIFRKKKAAPMTMAGARPGARPPIGPRAGPRTRPPIRKPRRGFSPRR
jgi:hypothetical protein